MKRLTLFLAGLALALCSCAPLNPGADPLVVRVEQAETSAQATFDLLLNTDDSNRAYFKANVPVFHSVCEWLRQPQQAGTNTLPRALALLWNIDNVKMDYKRSKVSSNALYSALVVFESTAAQASMWLTVVTNRPAIHQP